MSQRRPLSVLVLLGSLPWVAAACNDTTSSIDPRTQTALVRVAAVEPSGHTERSFTGIVAARVQSDLGFRVPGKILERLVDTGQSGAVSASAYDKVKAAAESARAELNSATAQADVARNETGYAVLLSDAERRQRAGCDLFGTPPRTQPHSGWGYLPWILRRFSERKPGKAFAASVTASVIALAQDENRRE
jgi:multidrug efflux pump subunit AcrA (membrane-fusion protein)